MVGRLVVDLVDPKRMSSSSQSSSKRGSHAIELGAMVIGFVFGRLVVDLKGGFDDII